MKLDKCETAIVLADRQGFLDGCPYSAGCVSCYEARRGTARQWYAGSASARAAVDAWRESCREMMEARSTRAAAP